MKTYVRKCVAAKKEAAAAAKKAALNKVNEATDTATKKVTEKMNNLLK